MMNAIYVMLVFGCTVGLFAVAVAYIIDRIGRRRQSAAGDLHIPKAHGIPALNPGALMARIGADAPAHQSLGTVTMRPTIGIKAFGIGIIGLMLYIMSGEHGATFRQDPLSLAIVGCTVFYVVVFLMRYEVIYDNEGVTIPGLLFGHKTHEWADLISIKQTDEVTYTLRFDTGTAKVRKFLVGMPTFLTFVAEVRELNKRR